MVLFLVAFKLLPKYSIRGSEDRIAKFIIHFISKVAKLSQSANEKSSNPYVRYAYFKKFVYLHIQDKYRIMASELLQAISDMIPKDPQHLFNETEKLAIYLSANEKCTICGQVTQFEQGNADHIVRHTDGGFTIIKNGRWLCKPLSHQYPFGEDILSFSSWIIA